MRKQHRTKFGGYMARINCPHCGSKLFIETSRQVTDAVREVYATCNNQKCLARPVMTISHKSDRVVPASQIKEPGQLIQTLLASLPEHEQKKLLSNYPFNKQSA